MPVPFGSKRVMAAVLGCAAALLVGGAAVTAAVAAPPPPPSFDTVFATGGEPAFLHLRLLFTGGGATHRMDLWRDHECRILRTTDARITTLATRTQGAGYDLVVLDHKRRTSTRISRDNLYRLGAFTDWFDLGHGLRHPPGAYRLLPTTGTVPATLPVTATSCRWFDLTQPGGVAHICWDDRDRQPLLIANGAWVPLWRVVSIDRATIPAARFALDDHGYIRNDADRDVEGD